MAPVFDEHAAVLEGADFDRRRVAALDLAHSVLEATRFDRGRIVLEGVRRLTGDLTDANRLLGHRGRERLRRFWKGNLSSQMSCSGWLLENGLARRVEHFNRSVA